MSTFKGTLNEDIFKGCVIDNFKGDVLNEGKVFFLSHFHTDHMDGLEDIKFYQILAEDPKSRLYCSTITRKLLLKKRRFLGIPADKIIVMEFCSVVVIPYDYAIRVTPLSAGHCPGSIMFLFEACDVKALYTGDFRWSERDLKLCKPLHDPDTHDVIKLNSLYLDTTFANMNHEYFPLREKSKDSLIRVIRQCRNDVKYFVIEPTASTGFEYLMVELYKEFKCKIHASFDLCQNILSCIDQLRNVTTTELNQSFIHFCTRTGPCHPCPRKDSSIKEKEILTIKPSAQYFSVHALDMIGNVLTISNNLLRVAYSSHASLRELAYFVSYLKPKTIYPSVVPKNMTADEVAAEIDFYIRLNRRRLGF